MRSLQELGRFPRKFILLALLGAPDFQQPHAEANFNYNDSGLDLDQGENEASDKEWATQGLNVRFRTVEAEPNQKVSLTVMIEIQGNVINESTKEVIGMKGKQTIKYLNAQNKEIVETIPINWINIHYKQMKYYEHPAKPERFAIQPRDPQFKQKWDIQTDHSEGGIAIHGIYDGSRSSGCILASDAVLNDIRNRFLHDEIIYGEILEVKDTRNDEEKAVAPLP